MVIYSIIQKSQLEGANRLDPEYYQPEYLELLKVLAKYHLENMGKISEVIYGTTPKGGSFESDGIPFVRSQNFSDGIIDTSDLVFCTEKFHNENKKSAIRPGDILFAAVGATIGELAVVQGDIKEGNTNQNIARIRIIDKDISPYFAGIFFLSKFGQFQIGRLITGNAQPYLNSDQIRQFRLPVLEKNKRELIAQYYSDIQEQTKTSSNLYQQAEKVLLEELGMGDWIPDQVGNDKAGLFNVINFSDIKSAERIDAEYFQPKYARLEKKIKEHNAQRLGDLVTVKKGFEPGSEEYLEQGKLFIRVSSLTKQGIIDKDQKYLSENLYKELKKDYEPKVGEILLTKDASPGVAYVVKESVEGIISGGIVRLKLKEQNVEPEYLALCISSLIGQSQVQRDAGGSVIMHWKPDQIKNLLLPILPQSLQKKISELVIRSHAARKKAKKLLEEAKTKVEELIEKSD